MPSARSLPVILLGCIFCIYTLGFISTVLRLPEVDRNHFLSIPLLLRNQKMKRNIRRPKKRNIHLPKILSENRKNNDNKGGNKEVNIGGNKAVETNDDDDADTENKEIMDVDDGKYYDAKRNDKKNASFHDSSERKDKENKLNEDVSKLSKISVVPKSIWPVTIRNEDGKWEDITHPGKSSVRMTVPKFWSLPIHDHKLMSREKAMQVGTCVTPDSSGNLQRGDACERKDRTIFVAIASYRDWQCRMTVDSVLSRAKYPGRIRIGVIDQVADGDYHCDAPVESCESAPSQGLCMYPDQVDVLQTDAKLSVGPVFARHLGHRLYRGEYYAIQSDAHVTFTQDWDVDIIEQLEATGDEMAVLSTYLTDIQGSIDKKTGKSLRATRPIMCNTAYEGGVQGKYLRHLSQPEGFASIDGQPQLQPYWSAGFSFSRGHFVVNVPYDQYQPMIFQGEEMSIAIRGFTIGYDFFAPERSVCFHHYASNNSDRNTVSHFWENSSRYIGQGKAAMKRLLGIVHMNPEVNSDEWLHDEEDRYGIGSARTPENFYEIFGVDVVAKKTIPKLCQFVDPGIMHNKFMKHLLSDGMGIDYKELVRPFPSYMN